MLPLLFYHGRIGRLVGVVTTLGFGLWLVGLNLTIGHFRDLFIENAGRVQMADLLHRLSTAPLILSDAKSGLLVVLGIVLAVVSVIECAGIRDPYPGFGAVGRASREAIAQYAEEKSRCLGSLTHLRNEAVDDMTSAIELIRNAEFEKQTANEGRTRLHHNYCAFLDALGVVHQRLIHRYREENAKARRVPPPGYFSDRVPRPAYVTSPQLAPMPMIAPDVGGDAVERIQNYIKALNERFEEALPQYETVGQLTARDAGHCAST
jgi:hypothetical protein